MLTNERYARFLLKVERTFDLAIWAIGAELDKAGAFRTNDTNAISAACPQFRRNDIIKLYRQQQRYMLRHQEVCNRIYA